MNLDLKISRKELQELRQSDIDGDQFLDTLLKKLIFGEMTSCPFTIMYHPARFRDEETVSANLQVIADSKADWLRSEIEKIVLPTPPDVLIPNESPIEHALREGEYHALTSIITRYKEELKVLESK